MMRARPFTALLGLASLWSCPATADTPPPTLTVLHYFSGSADGITPAARLLEGKDGMLYGSTLSGGINQGGTLFKLSKAGELTTLFSFGLNATAFDGSAPESPLIVATDGNFYGTTTQGGNLGSNTAGGYGTLFRLSADGGTLTTLHTFTGVDGTQPFAPLMQASDGNLYGTTVESTAFRLTLDGALTTIHTFALDGSEGTGPNGFLQGADGYLYGTASGGGYGIPGNGGGTIFRLSLSGDLTTLQYFLYTGSPPNGGNPTGGLTLGPDGAFYGLNRTGVAYKITAAGIYPPLHQFGCSCGAAEGSSPTGVLTLGSDGNLYGVTTGGGTFNHGVAFVMTPAGAVTTLHSFNGNDGDSPAGGLIEGSDGRLYGVTSGGFGRSTAYSLTFPAAAPGSVVASAGDGTMTLSWTAVKDATSYSVFLATQAAGEATTAIQTGLTGTSTTLPGLAGGTLYYATVAAVNEAGSGAMSAEVSARTLVPASAVTATPGDGQVVIDWTPAPGATSYAITLGSAAGAEGSTPVQSGITGPTATLTGLKDGTTYYLRVIASYGSTQSASSPELSAMPVAAPSDLAAVAADGQVTLSWTAASGADSYSILQGSAAGDEASSPVATRIKTNSTVISGLSNGATYFFKVASAYGAAPGADSAEISATPQADASPPVTSGGGGGSLDGLSLAFLTGGIVISRALCRRPHGLNLSRCHATPMQVPHGLNTATRAFSKSLVSRETIVKS